MMFSKLSIFVAATLAAFAIAAAPPHKPPPIMSLLNQNGTLPQNGTIPQNGTLPQNGPPQNGSLPQTHPGKPNNGSQTDNFPAPEKCCANKRPATDDDVKLAQEKLGVEITAGSDVWTDCKDFDGSQEMTCSGQKVCCKESASDGSIAVDCKDATTQ